ncbi:MAG: hypothetical protein WC479_06185 [Candidatus Izemoplasmatales bacterium]
MKIYSFDESINISQSVLRYLSTTYLYRNDANSGTLSTYYPSLTMTLGFPSDFTQVSLPTLTISQLNQPETDFLAYGELSEKYYPFRIDIFAGGETTNSAIDERKNMFMRDRMMNDVKNLLDANSGQNYVDLYNYADIISSGTSYQLNTDIMIQNVSCGTLEPTGDTEVDRCRAIVDFMASAIFSQD